ncbi:AfsR/SARP family transcriptional regulator [Streptomyces cyanogenus]|uniref:Regulatory protein AfsR n=1 Tax=Streptomyces cyanogenus TaxID=80860 RepID=A0ABX7TIM3_STRCY|nr:BTAD domain-containing putative transcriptional regulator [Streptomyces cyanogenus]QTD96111.1 Regulatory protein AfsR [Streptomyces cyanogenus]
MSVDFVLLGGIEARVGGTPVDLGHVRQRSVLAGLLVDANTQVPTARLVDRVWGDRPPQRAQATLYSYVSRLRHALATATGDVRITRRTGSYVLTVDPSAVDLHRFRDLVGQARTAAGARAAELFAEALALWRGEAFGDLDAPWFNEQRTSWHRERLAAELDLYDLLLRLGRHAELLAELPARAEQHPLDERLAGQLMLALYRSGRRSDALAHYRQVHRRLSEELGTDPGPELQRLHQQILASDTLTARSAPEPGPAPVPRQLPSPPGPFTGRTGELAELDKMLDAGGAPGGTVVISTIGGIGGIGKTWLAVHWAHHNAAAFPDGQLYADLRGFSPTAEPASAAEVVQGFLHALGLASTEIPADLPGRAAVYRSLVAGRRMLIVLDDARDAEQVLPLLPGSPSCTVLITSRRRLAGLVTAHGARPLALDVVSEAEARDMLVRRLGAERVAKEPKAAATLLDCCAGLPLALSIVAARAGTHPDFPLAALADELRDRSARLDALGTDDPIADLRAVLSSSYDALDPATARVFGLLGQAPGPDIGLPAAAALTALPVPELRSRLRQLEGAHLIRQTRPGRYRMHDLVRLYAAERATQDQHGEALDAALRGLVDFYADTAHDGDRLLSPLRTPFGPDRPDVTRGALPLRDIDTAMSWFEAEHLCLLDTHRFAMARGHHRQAWQLAWSLDTFHWRQGNLDDRTAMLRATLAAGERIGDRTQQASAHRLLGRAYVTQGHHATALEHLRAALALFEEAGDAAGTAQTHLNLALAWEKQGDDRQALAHALQNLRIRRTLDSPPREAEALNAVGWYHARLGHHPQSRRHCEEALALCRRHAFREGEAFTLDSLGYLAHRTGEHALALAYYGQALTLRRELGDAFEEADTLAKLGDVHDALGRPARAREAWRQARSLYLAQRRLGPAAQVEQKLARSGVPED